MFPKKSRPTLASTKFEKRSNLLSLTTLICLRNSSLEGPHWSSSFQISGIKHLPNPSILNSNFLSFQSPTTVTQANNKHVLVQNDGGSFWKGFTVNFRVWGLQDTLPKQKVPSKTWKFPPCCHWQNPPPARRSSRRSWAASEQGRKFFRRDTWNPLRFKRGLWNNPLG